MGIAMVGAGGHGCVSLECLELATRALSDVAFSDDRWKEIGSIENVSVLAPIDSLAQDGRFEDVFVAIGSNMARREVTLLLARGGKQFLTIIHPHTAIWPRAHLQEGTIAVAGTVVNRGGQELVEASFSIRSVRLVTIALSRICADCT